MRCLVLLLFVSIASAADSPLALTSTQLGGALAGSKYTAAIELLGRIAGLYASASKAEQKTAVKVVGKAAKSKDVQTRHGAFAALAAIGAKGSSKYLRRWLKAPKKPKPSHLEAIRAAGKIADPNTLSTLLKQSKHHDIDVAIAATQALGRFSKLKPSRRKELAFDLIKRLEALGNMSAGRAGRGMSEEQARKNPTIAAAIARNERLGVATVLALQQLTGEKYRTVPSWFRWRKKWKNQNPWK